ncbi:MAG: HipA N-terminal domain-containing protein [Thermodesulfobacteriota bacterium]
MRSAEVFFENSPAGHLTESADGREYCFQYAPGYSGPPISLTMPVRQAPYCFAEFPPFFDGLLPEGFQLEALLRQQKLDRNDKFSQLLVIGGDTVGAVTVKGVP